MDRTRLPEERGGDSDVNQFPMPADPFAQAVSGRRIHGLLVTPQVVGRALAES